MKDTALALSLAGLAFMMTVIWGGPLLRILQHFKIGKQIRVEEPGKHFVKMGTPTMGGVMIIIPVVLDNRPAECGQPDRYEDPGAIGTGAADRHARFRRAGCHRRLGRHPRQTQGRRHAHPHQIRGPSGSWDWDCAGAEVHAQSPRTVSTGRQRRYPPGLVVYPGGSLRHDRACPTRSILRMGWMGWPG